LDIGKCHQSFGILITVCFFMGILHQQIQCRIQRTGIDKRNIGRTRHCSKLIIRGICIEFLCIRGKEGGKLSSCAPVFDNIGVLGSAAILIIYCSRISRNLQAGKQAEDHQQRHQHRKAFLHNLIHSISSQKRSFQVSFSIYHINFFLSTLFCRQYEMYKRLFISLSKDAHANSSPCQGSWQKSLIFA